jgi:hypothetical protein
MKKLALFAMVLLLLPVLMGCSGKEKSIKVEDVTGSTMLARTDGRIQVATVEDFDKSYYDLKELQSFIDEQITSYNKTAGGDKITIDKVDVLNNKAVMLLTYSGMDQYSTFNKVTAAYFNGGVKNIALTLPATLVNVKNEALASTEEVIANDKYKILVLTEPYHIVLDGKVKFYSENAKLVDSNEVEGASEGMTVVAYKP